MSLADAEVAIAERIRERARAFVVQEAAKPGDDYRNIAKLTGMASS